MGVLWTPYSPHNESNLPCSCSVWQSCVVRGGGEEPQVVLRQHQRHYLNITNGVYMLLVIDGSICDLHWEKKKSHHLLYWITTTSISTSTSYTITYSVSSVTCTPPGGN